MNYHVWRGLRSMRPDPDGQAGGAAGAGRRQGWRNPRFKKYAAYACLGPMVIVAFTLIMQVRILGIHNPNEVVN